MCASQVLPDVFLVHHHLDHTIGVQLDNKQIALAKKKKDWTVGWSCWTNFAEAVERRYGFRQPEPCWVSSYVWPVLTKERGDKCVVARSRSRSGDGGE